MLGMKGSVLVCVCARRKLFFIYLYLVAYLVLLPQCKCLPACFSQKFLFSYIRNQGFGLDEPVL